MSLPRPLTFSVIVNTIDRAEPLRALLGALEHQSYPHFEVIAVVGPTRDHTLDVLAAYGDRVEVLRCPRANLSQSRNVGLLAARGDITAFVDDDAVPSRHWLAQLARLFADEDLDGTGGMVYCVHPSMPIVQHRVGIVSSLAEQADVRDACSDDVPFPGFGRQWTQRMMGTNMAFRRERLLGIGGFDEFFEWVYDDADVAIRLAGSGGIVEPVREAVVYHAPASSRNRKAYSWNFRTWVQTKSVLYFMLRNGRAAGEPPRTLAYRCARFLHGRWILGGNLRRERNLTWLGSWRMRALEMMGGAIGTWHGLRGDRRLIPADEAERARASRAEPIRTFPNERSPLAPGVDPVAPRPLVESMPERPLRICLLSHFYPPHEVEGIGRHTSLMARGLAELGHTVHVVTRGDREQTTFRDGAYVHRVKPSLERYARFASLPDLYHTLNHTHVAYQKIRRLVMNDGIEILDSPLWKVDGLVACMDRLLPVVVRVQTANKQVAEIQKTPSDDARLVGELEQDFLERASFLVANSEATVRALGRVYGIDAGPDRCTVIPHGIEPVPEEQTRPFAGDTVRSPMVLYVGRLERRKGILDLFSAIPRVLREIPDARFVIAGDDNSRSDGFQHRMGASYPTHFLRRHPRAASAVQFLGRVSDRRLADLYAACDLFVAPSLYESFGLIYLEAMNLAKPVVGCAAGGIPEVVEHGRTGLLVEPEAPSALAEAIVSLLRSPARLRDFGLAGRARLLERFTHRQMAERFAHLYREVIRRSGGHTASEVIH